MKNENSVEEVKKALGEPVFIGFPEEVLSLRRNRPHKALDGLTPMDYIQHAHAA